MCREVEHRQNKVLHAVNSMVDAVVSRPTNVAFQDEALNHLMRIGTTSRKDENYLKQDSDKIWFFKKNFVLNKVTGIFPYMILSIKLKCSSIFKSINYK